MLRILDHETRPVVVRDENGQEQTVELVRKVSYIDHTGALRELRFEPAGTDVSGEIESAPRVVGEHKFDDGTPMREFRFTDPVAAVHAYENGEVV